MALHVALTQGQGWDSRVWGREQQRRTWRCQTTEHMGEKWEGAEWEP